MSKSVNHHLVKWAIRVFLAAIFILIVCLFLFSCNPQRFPQKAYKEVLSNDTLKGKIINDYINAHPPIEGKPQIVYVPGAVQEKIISVKDQKEIDRVRDSAINSTQDACKESSLKAYDLGFAQAEKFYKENPNVRVDTTISKIPDLKEANRWRDTANKLNKQSSRLEGQLDSTTEASKAKDKKIDKLWFWLILLSVASVLSHVVRSYIPSIKLPFNLKK